MSKSLKYKIPQVHTPEGQAIADAIRQRFAESDRHWSPAMAFFLLLQIAKARKIGESVAGVLRAASVSYRTYWTFARGLTLGSVPMPWMPLRVLALEADFDIVPIADAKPQIFEAIERGKLKIFAARVGHKVDVEAVIASRIPEALELVGIKTAPDGCPLRKSKAGRWLRAPIGSDQFSRLLTESTGELADRLAKVGK